MYRAYETLQQMMRDRGYTLEKPVDEDEFDDGNPPSETFVSDTDNVVVSWVIGNKVKIDDINKLYTFGKENGVSHFIIISECGVTPPVNNVVPKLAKQGFLFEIFDVSELKFNITKHKWVPNHSALTTEQKLEILSAYKIKSTQVPRMLSTDPVAKYYGFTKGTMVRILRDKETTTPYVSYRIVS